MNTLPLNSLSEFGIDYGLELGRFNAVDDGSYGDFNDYWWRAICRFEDYLIKSFPKHSIFVSDHVPSRKNFCIDHPENLSFDLLCDRLLALRLAIYEKLTEDNSYLGGVGEESEWRSDPGRNVVGLHVQR